MTQDIEQFRAGFEAHAAGRGLTLVRAKIGDGYYLADTNEAWKAWTAAKLEASTEPSLESIASQLIGDPSPVKQDESLDEKAENALLWCYRRMKNSYGRLPFIEEAVAGLRARRAEQKSEPSSTSTRQGAADSNSPEFDGIRNSGVAPGDALDAREQARRLEITQVMLEQERMKNAHLLNVMMSVYSLAPNGEDIKLPDGRVFRFNDPNAAETLNALGRAIHAIPEKAAQALANRCGCQACNPHMVGRMMFICPNCGDKRCPHASNHESKCQAIATSTSNETK